MQINSPFTQPLSGNFVRDLGAGQPSGCNGCLPTDTFKPGQPTDYDAAQARLVDLAREHQKLREQQGPPTSLEGLGGDMAFYNMLRMQQQQLETARRLEEIQRTQGPEAAKKEWDRMQSEAARQPNLFEQPSGIPPFQLFNNNNSAAQATAPRTLGGLDSPLFVNGRVTTMRELERAEKRDMNCDGVIG